MYDNETRKKERMKTLNVQLDVNDERKMETVTVQQFYEMIRSQGKPIEEVTFQCPMCGTLQSAQDLIAAGAGENFDKVEMYLGFSCLGRWTHHKTPGETKGQGIGCNWTLGGLFRLHTFEVVDTSGKVHPHFKPVARGE